MIMLEQTNDLMLRAGALQVLTQSKLESDDQLELFQRLHSWAVGTIAEGDPPPSLQSTCIILRNLSSGIPSM